MYLGQLGVPFGHLSGPPRTSIGGVYQQCVYNHSDTKCVCNMGNTFEYIVTTRLHLEIQCKNLSRSQSLQTYMYVSQRKVMGICITFEMRLRSRARFFHFPYMLIIRC